MRRTDAARQLGGFVREHRTDGGRRLTQAALLTVVGAVGLAFGIPVTLATVGSTDGAPELAGLLLGVGLIGLGLAVWRFIQGFRTREQSFDVHERGLTHRIAGTATLVPWEDIASVEARGEDGRPLAEARGMGFTCVFRLREGRAIRVDTFTQDAIGLARTVHAAVHEGRLPRGRGHRPPTA
ncbi:hypothetical protein [Streptomyces sp. NBC_00525]|uniref:hypothetical protein n=1 Tax=Streptomyces sp. NBC_00525 TaxID=2903660 RepID=UPI002E81728E|nr:hypothetical protein [Streptomyces sp. NBC_00525]WUC95104.1 hypothetical protein OG710_16600 [Streptomyces sp. NBC_00525]